MSFTLPLATMYMYIAPGIHMCWCWT